MDSLCLMLLIMVTKIFNNMVSPYLCKSEAFEALEWRHNVRDGVSNHQLHGCLLNRLFRRRSQKASKLRVTGLCAGN